MRESSVSLSAKDALALVRAAEEICLATFEHATTTDVSGVIAGLHSILSIAGDLMDANEREFAELNTLVARLPRAHRVALSDRLRRLLGVGPRLLGEKKSARVDRSGSASGSRPRTASKRGHPRPRPKRPTTAPPDDGAAAAEQSERTARPAALVSTDS